MTIYVHSTEKNLVSKYSFPSYEITFFKTFSDLNEEEFLNSQRTYIFCIDDPFIIDEIVSHCKRKLIISSKFLISHFTKYKIFFSNSILGSMNNWKIQLIGFDDKDLIIDLEFKIIMMGGSMATELDDVTHLVVYKMHEDAQMQVFRTFSDCTNIFNVHWIEFYWKRSLLLLNTYDVLENLQEKFIAKYFQNCKMHLIGFDEYKLGEMLVAIFDNDGSIHQLHHIHSPCCIFIVPNNSESENVSQVLQELSKDSMKNVVTEDWFWQSVENQYLVKFDDYRILSPFTDCRQNIGENSKNLPLLKHEKKSTCQVPINTGNVNLQSSENINLSFSLSDKEVFVDEIKANYDLGFGFHPSQCSKEKCEEYEYRRYNLLLNLTKNIKDKLDVLNNFQALRTHKLIESSNLLLIFNIFKQITDFFQGFYDIFQPLVINYSIDCCIGMELLPHYNQLKKYFQAYNSKFNQMSDLIDRIDNNTVKEYIQQFVDSHGISSFKYFIEIPKRMLTLIQMQFDDIIKSTSKFHPDIAFFIEISQRNRHVTKLIETLEDKLIEGRNQLVVMKCIGNPAIVQIDNKYRTVVDCMHYCDDGLKCPKSLFLFDNTIVICNFKSSTPGKLFDKVMTHLKEQINSGNNLSRCPSIQSIYHCSPFIEMNIKRKNSLSSVTTVNSISVRKLEGHACSKFHKLFTGLSKLNWKENPENIYSETEILEKSSLISLISHRGNFDVQSQMFFTINYIDKQSKLKKNMKFFLVPRVVKHPFKYNKINVALPTDFDWEYNDKKEIKWDEFIVEEKRNFCAIIAQHYQMEFIEDSFLSNSMSSISFENDCFVNEKYFRTPLKQDKTTRNLSPSNSSFIGSIKKSPKSMSLKKTITGTIRRLTRFTKKPKNTLPSSSRNYILEDESQIIEIRKPITNYVSPENSFVISLDKTEDFAVLNQLQVVDRNSLLFSKENIKFSPNPINNQDKNRESRKLTDNSNSFIYIDESPTYRGSAPIDFNCPNVTQTPIENITNVSSDFVKYRKKETDDSSTIGDPITAIKRAVNKRRSDGGSNIQLKNRKF